MMCKFVRTRLVHEKNLFPWNIIFEKLIYENMMLGKVVLACLVDHRKWLILEWHMFG